MMRATVITLAAGTVAALAAGLTLPAAARAAAVPTASVPADYPTYDHLTQTTPVAFDHIRVWWAQQGQPAATETKLLGTPPAHARLYRYSMVNSAGTVIAAASKPTDHDNNFTITDK
jgi:hypothetical protein